jgi:hypothetical protein
MGEKDGDGTKHRWHLEPRGFQRPSRVQGKDKTLGRKMRNLGSEQRIKTRVFMKGD